MIEDLYEPVYYDVGLNMDQMNAALSEIVLNLMAFTHYGIEIEVDDIINMLLSNKIITPMKLKDLQDEYLKTKNWPVLPPRP